MAEVRPATGRATTAAATGECAAAKRVRPGRSDRRGGYLSEAASRPVLVKKADSCGIQPECRVVVLERDSGVGGSLPSKQGSPLEQRGILGGTLSRTGRARRVSSIRSTPGRYCVEPGSPPCPTITVAAEHTERLATSWARPARLLDRQTGLNGTKPSEQTVPERFEGMGPKDQAIEIQVLDHLHRDGCRT